MEATARDSERDAVIIRQYRSGMLLREVGRAHNISHERVRQILRRNGVACRSSGETQRGMTKATPAQRDEIVRLRQRDASVTAIAATLGLSWGTVARVLHAADWDTADHRHINQGGPRVCTLCLRTEREGAAFSPGESANRCRECVAAATRAWYRRNAERAKAAERERRARR